MLVGLHGKAGAGKDRSYTYIESWGRVNRVATRRDAFADRMKVSAAKALGYQGTDAECRAIMTRLKQPGWQIIVVEPGGAIEHPISGREYIQYYGTEAHHDIFGANVWIDLLMADYDAFGPELLVITDVRFVTEAAAIRDAGGEIWHITRPNPLIAEDHHVSEATLPAALIDRSLVNDQGLDHLEQIIYGAVRTLAMPERSIH